MSTYASNANYSHPKLPADIIRRPRLLRLLHENVDRKLIAVAAGPGYGKTTLLSQFADELDFPVCWVSLSPWNNDPTAFIESIVWSIQTHFPNFGHPTLSRLRSIKNFDSEELLSLENVLLRDIDDNVADYFCLILDDFHVVESNASITRFVSGLVTLLPENAHILISSRNKPTLPALARLVINREGFYLPSSVMKFTIYEAQQLLELVMNKKLDPADVKKINERIEGWAAALILLGQGDALEVPVDDDGSLLIEYLEQEVLTSHPAHIQAFLTLTSLFPVLVPENCNKLLGIENSQAILQELERCNLVREEASNGNSVYRYHSLLREFLQRKLETEQGEHIQGFAIRTASLLESADYWREAFDVCCQFDAFEPAAELIARICPELVAQGKWSTISQVIGMLPDQHVANHFELMVWQSQAVLELGDPDAALEIVNRALRSFERRAEPSQVAWGLINKSVVLRNKSRMAEAESACLDALEILKHTPEPERLEARAHHNIGIAAYVDGMFPKAAEHLSRALQGYEELDEINFASQAHDTLGAVYTDTGRLGDAVAHYNQALTGFQKVGNDMGAVLTLNNLGNAYFSMADYELAMEVLSDAISKASSLELDRYEAYAQVSLADIKRTVGRTNEALSAYDRGVELARASGETRLVIYGLEGQALSYLDSNDVDRANALLEEASALTAQNKFNRHGNLLLISHSMVARREGFHDKAIELLGISLKELDDSTFPLEHCRVRIHLAYTYHISRDYAGARAELQRVGEILSTRPDPYFLVPDLINMPGLLDFATEMQDGSVVYKMLSLKVGRIINDIAPHDHESNAEPTDLDLDPDRYPAISIEGFGLAKITLDGEEVTSAKWRSNKAKELVLYLAQLGRPATKDELIAALWPHVNNEKGDSGLKSNLFRARKALYADCLLQKDRRYEFSPKGDFSFDVADYGLLLDHADRLPESIRPASIEGAVEIYRGPFLPEMYSDWCSEERERLAARQLHSLAALADHYASHGNYNKAAQLTQEVLKLDPYNDHAAELTIRHLAESGNLPAATYFYRWYVQFLDRELGLKPSDYIRNLYESLFPGQPPED